MLLKNEFILHLIIIFNYSVDPFTRKDWYDVKAPAMFSVRNVGKTLVNRTQGTSMSIFLFHFFVHFCFMLAMFKKE